MLSNSIILFACFNIGYITLLRGIMGTGKILRGNLDFFFTLWLIVPASTVSISWLLFSNGILITGILSTVSQSLGVSEYWDTIYAALVNFEFTGKTYANIILGVIGVSAIRITQTGSQEIQKWASVLGLLGQPAWFYVALADQNWGIFILCLFYTEAWLRGFKKHWIEPRRKAEVEELMKAIKKASISHGPG